MFMLTPYAAGTCTGKRTESVYRLKVGEAVHTIQTRSFNVERVVAACPCVHGYSVTECNATTKVNVRDSGG
jgi:hypothetical protein